MQRLGHLLRVLEADDAEDRWFDLCTKAGAKFKYVALKASVEKHSDDVRDERWKIIVNQKIEMDEI